MIVCTAGTAYKRISNYTQQSFKWFKYVLVKVAHDGLQKQHTPATNTDGHWLPLLTLA
jgi:hypothetical protein